MRFWGSGWLVISRVSEWLGSCLALDVIVYGLWLGSGFGFHSARQTYFRGFSTRLARYFCYSFFTISFSLLYSSSFGKLKSLY